MRIIKNIFKEPEKSLPDKKAQEEIGNLTLHYVDKSLTRIEQLAKQGRVTQAITESNMLITYFQNIFTKDISLQCNTEQNIENDISDPAFEYLRKLSNLIDKLIQSGKLDEAKALIEYSVQIKNRIDVFNNRLQQIVQNQRRKI